MKAALPPDEAERLEALGLYRVLDTPREQQFDDITRLAAYVCGAPTALISLVDRDRQWFKASVGFDPHETSREVSFCAHAILAPDDVLVVADARKDARFSDNPLVTGDGIRFYAGAPLVMPDGHALGTLCVLDRVPRTLEPEQIAALRALRRMVVLELETRRQAEQLAAARADGRDQRLMQAVLDNVEAGIIACDATGSLTVFNRTAQEFHGLSYDLALPPERWAEGFDLYLADGETLMARDQVPLVRALSGETLRGLEIVIKPKGLPARVLLVSGQPMLDGQGRKQGAVVALLDVSERKRAEQDLRRQGDALHQSEKLAAMGALLAGVAHELNNPLAVVMGQASMLQRMASGTGQADRAEKIARSAERCARIVRNFLAMARQQPPERGRVAINHVVEAVLELVSYPLRSDGIEVRLELGPGLPLLWADNHQLQQALINLLTNAHHALRQSQPPRRITVSTSHDPQERRVIIEVADTGPGIPAELLPRIFDPFFTTKREGEGTGLGLPLCRGIVESHGGSLSVASEPGHGATFRIDLPIGSKPVVPAPMAAPAAAPAAEAQILVVDDEEGVRDVLADMLGQEGHRVETAANGAEALEKARGRSFDLILSDLRMPQVDGPSLYRELVRRDPRMERRFIFMTGDILSPGSREFLESTPAGHFAKPFDPTELRRAVGEALERLGSEGSR